jgi:hypothetical protein
MAVIEELQVLTHDERVKQPFVHEIEASDRPVLPGVVHEKLEHCQPAGLRSRRVGPNVEGEFNQFGNARNECHPTAPACASTLRPNVRIHGTAVREALRGDRHLCLF